MGGNEKGKRRALDETVPLLKAATTLRPLKACLDKRKWVRCVGIGVEVGNSLSRPT